MSVLSSTPLVCHDGENPSRSPINRDRRRLIRWFGASLSLSMALSACGKKGELELPSRQPAIDDQASDDGTQ